jgi:flagellin
MSFSIKTNTQSTSIQRSLSASNSAQTRAQEKLASGSRVNRASDDAAALSISEKQKAEIRSMRQASRNAQDGISILQIAEGAMSEVTSLMIRMRELGIQAATDTIGDRERALIDIEFQELMSEISRISETTAFEDIQLLGSLPDIREIQVGIKDDPDTGRVYYDVLQTNVSPQRLGIDGIHIRTAAAARSMLGTLDEAASDVNRARAGIGAMTAKLAATVRNLADHEENTSSARSRIADADVASETAELARARILMEVGTALLGQANVAGGVALKLLG